MNEKLQYPDRVRIAHVHLHMSVRVLSFYHIVGLFCINLLNYKRLIGFRRVFLNCSSLVQNHYFNAIC